MGFASSIQSAHGSNTDRDREQGVLPAGSAQPPWAGRQFWRKPAQPGKPAQADTEAAREGGSGQPSLKSGCRSKGEIGERKSPMSAVLSAPVGRWSWSLERLVVPEHSAQGSYQEVEKEQESCQLCARVPFGALAQEQFGWSRIRAFPKQAEDAPIPI